MIRFLFLISLLFLIPQAAHADSLRKKGYNELALDVPTDGGAMLMFSRMWVLAKYVHGGFMVGGGQIQRNFDLSEAGMADLKAHSEALVLPFVGPRLGLYFPYVGLSLGYGVFWAKTDLDVNRPGVGTLAGQTRGWGTGFYSPLLVLNFYDTKHNVIFGFGLGGFLSSSYPTQTATLAGSSVSTTASPIDSLTVHFQLSWAGGRRGRKAESDDDF